MLIFCAILIGFLLVVVILVNKLYSGLEKQQSNIATKNNYQNIETKLKKAAQKYYQEIDDDTITVISSDELLEEKYLTNQQLTPPNSKIPCTGYVIVKLKDSFIPYISCQDYETEGY